MASFASLGKVIVVTPGVPVPLAFGHAVHSIQVQALPANAGIVYIGVGGLVRATFAGVLAVLLKPSSATQGVLPFWQAGNENAFTGIDTNELFIDADTGNDGVLVTLVLA